MSDTLFTEVAELIPTDLRVYGDQLNGRRKPDPFSWQLAAEKLKLSPDQLLAIDNSPSGIKESIEAGYGLSIGLT